MLELKVTIFYSNVTTLNIPVLHKKLKKLKPSRYRHADAKRRGIELLLILDLGTRWGEWLASRPAALYLRERTPVPIG